MSEGLRFLMVTTFYPPFNFGGDGIGVQRLARALVQRGHHVTVVHDADAYHALGPRRDPPGGAPDGVEVVSLHSRLGRMSPLLTQQTGRPIVQRRSLETLVRHGHYDVTWFHNISLVGGPGVLSLGSGVRIYEAHEHWLVCPSHVLWRHGREVCTGKQCLRCVLHHRRPPQLWRYTGYLTRQLDQVDAFIAKSRFSADKHREFGFPKPMTVVPYFLPDLDDSAPNPAPDPSPHARPYFLFVGRLEKIKGLDDVLPVFQQHPDADLLIAGDGEYGDTLRRLAADHPRIRFLGRVEPAALARYYAHALALIVPSVCFETFGIIIIEAFRQGTPVLTRDLGPFPELVRHGAGETFTTPEELLAGMRRLHVDPERRAALGRRAREAFTRHWSTSAVLPQYLAVVREAAKRRGHTALAERLREEIAA